MLPPSAVLLSTPDTVPSAFFDGVLPRRLFIDWYLCEERANDLEIFLAETFPGAGAEPCSKRLRSRTREAVLNVSLRQDI